MSNFITKEFSKVAVAEEITEGTYEAPTATEYLAVTEDGVSFEKTRETLPRNLLTGDRITKHLELSTKDVAVTIPLELKAGEATGDAPECALLLESFGFANQGLTADVTSAAGHTTSILQIEPADITKFKDEDIILVKQANAYHVTPVTKSGNTLIMRAPMASAPADNVIISKSKVYRLDKTQDKTLSFTRVFEGDQVLEKGLGLRCNQIQVTNFAPGQLPGISFSLQGMNFHDELLETPGTFEPDYNQGTPNEVRLACIYKDSTKLKVSEIGLTIDQAVTKIKTTCAANGSIGQRATGKINVTTTINPYKEQDDLGFTLDNATYNLFWSLSNPTNEAETEINGVVAINIPKNKTTASSVADVDGIHTDSVTAMQVPASEDDSIVIAFF